MQAGCIFITCFHLMPRAAAIAGSFTTVVGIPAFQTAAEAQRAQTEAEEQAESILTTPAQIAAPKQQLPQCHQQILATPSSPAPTSSYEPQKLQQRNPQKH